ncbi:hypothetical protein [Pseudoalteromonas sp. 31A1]|uniref:hypothetical protein n=1 Tax=Pseudoalteromonas sp. 31A1 TaxID=2686351 RepID=UPI0013FD3925|nr:hypothetical protein [Pseudoalteromonas sp. 31A1]
MNLAVVLSIAVPSITGLFFVATKSPGFYEKLINKLFLIIWFICILVTLCAFATNITIDEVLLLSKDTNLEPIKALKVSPLYEFVVLLVPIPSMIILWVIGYIGSNLYNANRTTVVK